MMIGELSMRWHKILFICIFLGIMTGFTYPGLTEEKTEHINEMFKAELQDILTILKVDPETTSNPVNPEIQNLIRSLDEFPINDHDFFSQCADLLKTDKWKHPALHTQYKRLVRLFRQIKIQDIQPADQTPFNSSSGNYLPKQSILNILVEDFRVSESVGRSDKSYPSVAMDGQGNAIMVWRDSRKPRNDNMFLQRFDASGDPVGDNFEFNQLDQTYFYYPKVAADDEGNYVVVWRGTDNTLLGQMYDVNDNSVGDHFTISNNEGAYLGNDFFVAMNDDGRFVVTWRDKRNGNYDIYAQRFSADGTAQGSNFKVNDDTGDGGQSTPQVGIEDDGDFVIVWKDYRSDTEQSEYQINKISNTTLNWNGISFQRYSSHGAERGSNTYVCYCSGSPGLVVSPQGNFIVAYNRGGDLRFRRFNSSGVQQGDSINIAEDTYGYSINAAMDDDGNFTVMWEDNREYDTYKSYYTYARHFYTNGSSRSSEFRVLSSPGQEQDEPAIGMAPSGKFWIIWEDDRYGFTDIYAKYYSSAGATYGSEKRINDDIGSANKQDGAISADTTGNFWIVWEDNRNGNYDIYGQRYNYSGQPISNNFMISEHITDISSTYYWDQNEPDIAIDSYGNVKIVWEDYRSGDDNIYYQRYYSSGNPLGDNIALTSTLDDEHYSDPVISMNSSGAHVIVWEKINDTNSLQGIRYSSFNTTVGSIFQINDADGIPNGSFPDVAIHENDQFAVAWSDNRYGNLDIYCQMYDASGNKIGSNFLVNKDYSGESHYDPNVAYDAAGNLIVAWQDHRNGNDADIYFQRFTGSGSAIDENTKVNTDGSDQGQNDPVILIQENGFLIIWEDYRYRTEEQFDSDIFAQLFDKDWNPVGDNFQINADTSGTGQQNPRAVFGADDQSLITCWDDGRNPYQNAQIYANIFDLSDMGIKQVEAPVFSPAAGTYTTAQQITITCETDSSTIYHTTNGSDPDSNSTQYTSPVNLSTTTTLKAIAYQSGWQESDITTGLYTITGQVAAPTFSPEPGVYTSAQNVTISCSTNGATIYYTTNGTEPNQSSAAYTSPISVDASLTIKAKAYKTDWDPSETATGQYTITGQVATPGFSPAPGTYTSIQSVTITCATEGASVYYTTNGSDPTEQSTLYSDPVSINRTTTLKARAYLSQWAPSEITSGLYTIDYQGITLLHTPTSSVTAGENTTLSTTVLSDSGVSAVMLMYRQGGDRSYQSQTMTDQGSNLWSGTIDATSVDEKGLQYYFEVSDTVGNTETDPNADPATSPYSVPVSFSSLNCPNTTPAGSYRMISVPVDLDNTNAAAILPDDLGNQDPTIWRLVEDLGDSYAEYGEQSISAFEPGNGYWLITKEAETWDVGSGQSVNPDSFQMTLAPGWNQIGHPFAFSVDWVDVITTAGNVEPPVGYAGSGNNTSGYQYNRSKLEPWKGYYIKNLENYNVTIEIPPKTSSSTIQKPLLSRQLQPEEWLLTIKAQVERSADTDNVIGMLYDADEKWDIHDLSEAPPFGDYVSIAFSHEAWKLYPGNYTHDIRSVNPEGTTWKGILRTNQPYKTIRLSFQGIDLIPDNLDVWLINETQKQVINLRETKEIEMSVTQADQDYPIQIVTGPAEFIQQQDQIQNNLPRDIKLFPNYPNPFNSSTLIRFEVPEKTQVSLRIVNNVGKTVRILVKNHGYTTGRHTIAWQSLDQSGRQVSSGIYLCVLEAGSVRHIQKLILIR